MTQDILREPGQQELSDSLMAQFMTWLKKERELVFEDYLGLHQWSVSKPADFWQSLLQFSNVVYQGNPDRVFSGDWHRIKDRGWFPDLTLNFAENLMRHLNASATTEVVTEISDARGRRSFTGKQLQDQVEALSGYLLQQGVQPGDRVACYLGNTVEAMIGMLATASIGAVWSSASPDFGLDGVLDRFGQIEPKVLLAGNGYCYGDKLINRLDEVARLAKAIPSVGSVILVPCIEELAAPEMTVSWDAAIQQGLQFRQQNPFEFMQLPFDHPLYILFSSGTTGKPKCIIHGAGGTLLQHSKELMLHGNIQPNDVFLYFTTTGWMMWNWLMSGLLTGARLVLFDGFPGMTELWQLVADERVTHFGTSAKFISNCRGHDFHPAEQRDLSALKTIFSTGSPLQPEDFDWIYQEVDNNVHLASISGGTDIVSCWVGGNPILPVRRGRIQCAGLGMNVQAFDEQGHPVVGGRGELVCTTPAPCMPLGFWQDEDGKRFHDAYFDRFENAWAHGDYIEFDSDGSCVIYGRSDATLNPGGVRIGTAEIYRQVETLPEVEDSLVVGQPYQGDVRVVLFVKMADGYQLNANTAKSIRQTLRSKASPRHVPALIIEVSDIPYTRSGKKVELAALKALQGEPIDNLTAIANAGALDEIKALDLNDAL